MKAGKLRSAFGKVNTMHTHGLPWTDRPLVTRNLLGGDQGISDAGVSVARLLPNPWIFLEATGELYQGQSELFHATIDGISLTWGMYAAIRTSRSRRISRLAPRSPTVTTMPVHPQRPGFLALMGRFAIGRSDARFTEKLLARSELAWSRRSELGGQNAFSAYIARITSFHGVGLSARGTTRLSGPHSPVQKTTAPPGC